MMFSCGDEACIGAASATHVLHVVLLRAEIITNSTSHVIAPSPPQRSCTSRSNSEESNLLCCQDTRVTGRGSFITFRVANRLRAIFKPLSINLSPC